jgi:hypothetical protein
MRITRSYRRIAAVVTLVCVGFAQVAIAAHASTAALGSIAPSSLDMVSATEPCMHADPAPAQAAAHHDQDVSKLCLQHCQSDQQNIDQHTFVPTLSHANSPVLIVPLGAQPDLALPRAPITPVALFARSTAPPLSIRYCVFRT